MTDRIGSMLGQYKIVEKLGEGGMGVVYKAVDTMIEREVAIKVLTPEIARQPNLLERFRSEAITVAKLNHSGTIPRAGLCRVMGRQLRLGPYLPIKMKMLRPTQRSLLQRSRRRPETLPRETGHVGDCLGVIRV
jgi:serine/threonine protein kinase